MPMEASSGLVLQLYRAAREMPTDAFQDFAIGLLKPLLRFDASFWGTGVLAPASTTVFSVHEHESDPEALKVWADINAKDRVIPIGIANPGTTMQYHAPSFFAAPEDAEMREFARRYGRQSYLITQLPHGDTGTNQWLSLYRPDPDAQYTETERLICQALMPHFAEALRISHALNANSQVFMALENDSRAMALADYAGRIKFVQRKFLELAAREWSQFDGEQLPAVLLAGRTGTAPEVHVGHAIRFSVRRRADMLLVEARPRSALDDLPAQRGRIAWLYASGHSHKEIARRMQLAPSTVRNQIRAAYVTLGITGKNQLIAAAQRAEQNDALPINQPDTKRRR